MSEVVRRLLALLRPQAGQVVVSAACRVVNQGLGVAIPAMAVALVFAAMDGSIGLTAALLALAGLALVKGVFRYLEQYTGHAVAFRLLAELRNRVFNWLERIEAWRLEVQRSGDLVARLSGDIDRVEPFYAHTIAPLVAALLVPVLTVVGMAWQVEVGVALALAPFPVAYLVMVPWLGWRRVSETGPRIREMSGDLGAAVADTVQGATEIAILGAGDRAVAAIGEMGKSRRRLQALVDSRAASRSLVGGVISVAAVLAVVLVGIETGLDLPEFSVAVVLAWTVMTPLRALEQIVPDTEQALASAARLFEIEDIPARTRGDVDVAANPPIEAGQVRFEGVTVRSGSATLLDSVDLLVPAGSFVGVVGPSGSGKTTMVETLVRHRDPIEGRVLVGGSPVDEISPESLARVVALVPQRPDVFHGTLADNLRLARAGASDEALMAALDRARLRDWVEQLEDGLGTHIGERGAGLSGGQLQRLALARAFLRDPSVLVLDEATSELDPVTEQSVLAEIMAERGRRTLIVVAHRMETVVSADRIVVMDRGRIVETGTHPELNAAEGLYTALWRRHEDMIAG